MNVATPLLVLAVSLAGSVAVPAAAAEPCPSSIGTPGNPAFGTPRPCPSAATPSPSARAKGKQDVVRSSAPGGGTTYVFGDTTVTVRGSISADVGLVHGTPTR